MKLKLSYASSCSFDLKGFVVACFLGSAVLKSTSIADFDFLRN